MSTVYVLDIDGVVVGKEWGVNYPGPNKAVVSAIQAVQARGDIVSFCTGRAAFSTAELANSIGLNSLQIADGGAVVWNPLSGEVIREATIGTEMVSKAVGALKRAGIWTEIYTKDCYFVEKEGWNEIGVKHSEILQTVPKTINSFTAVLADLKVTKIFVVVTSESERAAIGRLHDSELSGLDLTWSFNPNALPAKYAWFSSPGISKGSAVQLLSERLRLPLSNFIGVGDTDGDWSFMSMCGKVCTLENGEDNLKALVKSRGGEVLPDVSKNGLVTLLQKAR